MSSFRAVDSATDKQMRNYRHANHTRHKAIASQKKRAPKRGGLLGARSTRVKVGCL